MSDLPDVNPRTYKWDRAEPDPEWEKHRKRLVDDLPCWCDNETCDHATRQERAQR